MTTIVKTIAAAALLIATINLSACGLSTGTQMIDLDKVLDIFIDTLVGDGTADGTTEVEPVEGTEEDPDTTVDFLTTFNANLNDAKVMSGTVAVNMQQDGSLLGFQDLDNDATHDNTEAKLFTIEIDEERNRVILTDLQNGYVRDGGYRGGGLFTGYLLGSMLGRQNAFYAGRGKPNFAGVTSSPRGYHTKAVSDAKARAKAAKSARSSGGSRGFRSGK